MVKKINKICIFINWVREVDMYKNLIKYIPKNKLIILINDINHLETIRKNNLKDIISTIKKENLRYKFFSKIYNKEKYKVLLSTGESGARKIDLVSILKFFYSRSLGLFVEKTNLSNLFLKLFDRPFTGQGYNSKIYRLIFPEKNLGDFVIKFPWGMDINKKKFPDKNWEKNFDFFFSHGEYDSKLIKKKFKNHKTLIIGYPRYANLPTKKNLLRKYNKIFKLRKNKKKIFWIPTHLDREEVGKNIIPWLKKIKSLIESYDVIIRPHTKTINFLPEIKKKLRKEGFVVDDRSNRKIGEIFKLSDIVFADYGGSVFSSIFLNKPTLLLNLPHKSKYLIEKRKIQTFDLLARQKLRNLFIDDNSTKLMSVCDELLKNHSVLKIKKIKEFYFGKEVKINSIKKITKFLLKKLNS